MLANVLTRSIDDRWRATFIGAVIVGVFLVGGLAAYQQIDLSLYNDLPEGVRSVMNIPDGADVASLAFGVIYGFMGAMTLAGFALSMGASSIAGEERDGTIGLLLASPRSRTQVLVAKVVAMVAVIVIGALVLLLAASIAPGLVGVEMGSTSVSALVLHLFANALFFGFLAAAVGAWTGNRVLAVGVSAGVMVVSYVAFGLLPLLNATADAVKVLPWYYFDGSKPFVNGVSGGHLAVQFGGSAVLAAIAFLGVTRRDLRTPGGGMVNLLDRLRANPRTAEVFDRLAGRARVSRIWVKAGSENQALLIITAVVMFSTMGVLMGLMFAAIEDTLISVSADLPENMLALFGGGDLSTPEGWYQVETFGLTAPIAVMLVTVTAGARALAGEEGRRTMGLLLANPVSRRRIVAEKAVAMALHGLIVGVATFAGVVGGSVIFGLGMSITNIAATCVLVTLLGLMFGAFSLAVGAATGRVKQAMVATIAVAGGLYVVNSLLTVAESLESWARVSPFNWYLGHDPLRNGMDWGSAAVFVVLTAALVWVAAELFDRRDLRLR